LSYCVLQYFAALESELGKGHTGQSEVQGTFAAAVAEVGPALAAVAAQSQLQ
jgi:hypothetical protein